MYKFRWLFLSLFLLGTPALAETIIANTTAQLPKTLSVEEARNIFTLKYTQSEGGYKFQVFVLPREAPSTRKFLLDVLGVSPSAYFDMLDSYSSVGKMSLPIVVESEARMIISVGVTKGAVGFVRNPDFANSFNSIQIILVR